MTETPRHWTNPWVAFSAGAVAMLTLLLAWGAWNRLVDAPHRIQAALGADLPQIPAPRLPEAPRLPPVPVPAPR